MVKKKRKMWNIYLAGVIIFFTNQIFFSSFFSILLLFCYSAPLSFSTFPTLLPLLLLLVVCMSSILKKCLSAWRHQNFSRLSNDNVTSGYDDRLDKSPSGTSATSPNAPLPPGAATIHAAAQQGSSKNRWERALKKLQFTSASDGADIRSENLTFFRSSTYANRSESDYSIRQLKLDVNWLILYWILAKYH